ncbi:MAG: phosphoribosylglycinamide formyltransferase [Spirochaetales bacterium]|nr:phosphoribosylglycinamide formyltransferase [Spirochaetales bacterium]
MRIGVLASGGGTNLQAIIDACAGGGIQGQVALVVSNNSAAGAFDRARKAGIPTLHASTATHPDPADLDGAILDALTESGVDLIALAGYMKKLGPMTLAAYKNKTVNIHPALLPDFGGRGMYGMAVHRAVIASGVEVTGPTVHLVTDEYDDGPILAQEEVPVLPGDTPESLQQRVLEVEHRVYPATIDAFDRGLIAIHEGSPDTVIRPLCITKDYDAAVSVIRSAFRTPAQRFNITRENCPTHPSFTDRNRLSEIRSKGGVFFGAYRQSRMIGCVAVEPSRDEAGTWYLEKLAVPPDYRLTGLGSLLLDHACRAAGSYGGERISIGLIDADEVLKGWYRRRGFSETGTRTFSHLPFTVCFMNREMT